MMPLHEIVPTLQVAIGPVILISGVGLLLLSMTNRLGRVVDRSRALAERLRHATAAETEALRSQLEILMRRASLCRLAIILASVSVLLAACLVIALFLAAFLGLEIAWAVAALFVACMLALIASLFVFLRDIELSLAALRLDVEATRRRGENGSGA